MVRSRSCFMRPQRNSLDQLAKAEIRRCAPKSPPRSKVDTEMSTTQATPMDKVRITDVRTVLLTGPATLDPFLSVCRRRRSVALIEIDTNAGVTGVGETYAGYFCP